MPSPHTSHTFQDAPRPRTASTQSSTLPSSSSTHADGTDPFSDRRHSLGLMRKPLRSSPLAGPAVSESHAEPVPLRTLGRMLSFPNLRAPSKQTEAAKASTLTKRPSLIEIVKRPRRSNTLSSPAPPLPTSPLVSPPPATGERKGYRAKPPAPLRLHSAPTIPIIAVPPPSPRHHARARSRSYIDPCPSPITPTATDLSAFPLPPSNFPIALTTPSSRRPATFPTPPSSSAPSFSSLLGSDVRVDGDSSGSWLTSLGGDTPRFSRLGLAAPTVILPVSAKQAKRRSLRGQGGRRVSLTVPPLPSFGSVKAPINPPNGRQLHAAIGIGMVTTITPPRSSSLIHSFPPLYTPYSPSASSTNGSIDTPSLRSSRSPSLSSEGPTTPSAASFGLVVEDGMSLRNGSLDVSEPDLDHIDTDLLSAQVGLELALVSPRRFVFGESLDTTPPPPADTDSIYFVHPDDEEDNPISVAREARSPSSVPTLRVPLVSKPSPPPSILSVGKDTASIISDSKSSMWLSRPVHRKPYTKGDSFLWFGSGDSVAEDHESDTERDFCAATSRPVKTALPVLTRKASALLGVHTLEDNSCSSASPFPAIAAAVPENGFRRWLRSLNASRKI
ncbi:hypothetical protein MKEN_01352700 [Mycena kentingensis (nom. inval.)]|nr:hypothetical protein MKEN_01352700 [Mycena kentingensis (nom. inval.)]